MEQRLLSYFLMVCEELHVTRAAERLGISQPTLSHQIQLLEQQAGAPLFVRIGKRIHLSEAGRLLQRHAVRALRELEQARTAIGELRGLQRGTLRIGCAGNHLAVNALIAYHSRYPAIELSVRELSTDEIRDGLLANRLDLGIVYLPLLDEQLQTEPLFADELQLAAAAGHPLARTDRLPLRELQGSPLAMLQRTYLVRQFFDRYCEEEGFLLRPVIEMSTLDSLLRLARTGVCAAVLPRSFLQTADPADIAAVRIVDPAPVRTAGLVYRREAAHGAALEAMIALLREGRQANGGDGDSGRRAGSS